MIGTLQVNALGKSYREWRSEWRRIASWFLPNIKPVAEHWVLRGVSFSIGAGEAVGIVGQNGAGKSTLLKLITSTTTPSEGYVQMHGRVAAILELGMGFNPDLTGRENAYHSAGLMGYSHADIARVMPEIEAFAEIGDYFDQPLRVYSSGMQARVSFAVATAFKPDLLIVDEVLSVGDSYFQHKSFARIRKFRDEGVSIMLVTHSLADVRTLCDRAILLEQGRVAKDGLPDEVVDYYNALIAAKENAKLTVEQRRDKNGWLLTKSGTGEAKITSLSLHDAATGQELTVAQVDQVVQLRLNATALQDLPQLVIGLLIRDKQGHTIWGSNTWHTQQPLTGIKQGECIRLLASFSCRLGSGSYSVTAALSSSDTHLVDNFEWVDNLLVFDVINVNQPLFIGSTWLDAILSLERVAYAFECKDQA